MLPRVIAALIAYNHGHLLIGRWVEARGIRGVMLSRCGRCYLKVGVWPDGSISGQAVSTMCTGRVTRQGYKEA